MIKLRRVLPFPVEVEAADVGPIVPVNDTIGVHHGDDLEYEMLAKFLGFLAIGQQVLKDAVTHVR